MKLFFVVLCLSVIIIAYITYNVNEYMGNSLELREINYSNKKCHLIGIKKTFNSIIPFNDKFILAAEYNPFLFDKMNYLSIGREQNKLYIININDDTFSEIKINNFPKIPFHPHSMSLYKTSSSEYILYILNHAVAENFDGVDRIELINIKYNSIKESFEFKYGNTITLPEEFFLKTDSIQVINEDVFSFTTSKSFPSMRISTAFNDITNKIKYYAYYFLNMNFINIKKCNVYLYNKKEKPGKEISVLNESESMFNKGIAYDKKRNLLYVVKAMEKKMNIFKINEKNKIELFNTIPILYAGGNVFYDSDEDKIYIGVNGKMSELEAIKNSIIKNGNDDNAISYSGYEIIDPNNNYSINHLMIMKNKYKGVSSAIKIGKKIAMSSVYSKGIYVCQNKE